MLKSIRENINRLWVRLSIAFALVVLIGVMLTSCIGPRLFQPQFFAHR